MENLISGHTSLACNVLLCGLSLLPWIQASTTVRPDSPCPTPSWFTPPDSSLLSITPTSGCYRNNTNTFHQFFTFECLNFWCCPSRCNNCTCDCNVGQQHLSPHHCGPDAVPLRCYGQSSIRFRSWNIECCAGHVMNAQRKCVPDVKCSDCQQLCLDTNSIPAKRCACRTGYLDAGNGACRDINECIGAPTHQCTHRCHNNVGSYTCSCFDGYSLLSDGHTCSDINECSEGTHDCTQLCTNTLSSFRCSCMNGYALASDMKTCLRIDECGSDNGGCEHSCRRAANGDAVCSCRTGFQLHNNMKNCIDINECSSVVPPCEHANQCRNTLGSFSCSCNAGFRLEPDGLSCTPIDGMTTTDNVVVPPSGGPAAQVATVDLSAAVGAPVAVVVVVVVVLLIALFFVSRRRRQKSAGGSSEQVAFSNQTYEQGGTRVTLGPQASGTRVTLAPQAGSAHAPLPTRPYDGYEQPQAAALPSKHQPSAYSMAKYDDQLPTDAPPSYDAEYYHGNMYDVIGSSRADSVYDEIPEKRPV